MYSKFTDLAKKAEYTDPGCKIVPDQTGSSEWRPQQFSDFSDIVSTVVAFVCNGSVAGEGQPAQVVSGIGTQES